MGTKTPGAIKRSVFTSPAEVEQSFYEALREADLDKLMQTWADDEDIVCIHPNGERLVGQQAIQTSWKEILSKGPLSIEAKIPVIFHHGMTVIHTVLERHYFATSMGQKEMLCHVTNIYQKSRNGWHMILHHASLAPPDTVLEDTHPTVSMLLH